MIRSANVRHETQHLKDIKVIPTFVPLENQRVTPAAVKRAKAGITKLIMAWSRFLPEKMVYDRLNGARNIVDQFEHIHPDEHPYLYDELRNWYGHLQKWADTDPLVNR